MRGIPVADADGVLVGIVTEKDVLHSAAEHAHVVTTAAANASGCACAEVDRSFYAGCLDDTGAAFYTALRC